MVERTLSTNKSINPCIKLSDKNIKEQNYLHQKRDRQLPDILDEQTLQNIMITHNNDEEIITPEMHSFNDIYIQRQKYYEHSDVMRYHIYSSYKTFKETLKANNPNKSKSIQDLFHIDKGLYPSDISTNVLSHYPSHSFICPNSLFYKLVDLIEKGLKNKDFKHIYITGDEGIGKTCGLMLYSYLLRLSPFNIVISIFDYQSFIKHPIDYLINEVFFGMIPITIIKNNKNSLNDIIEKCLKTKETKNDSDENSQDSEVQLTHFRQIADLLFCYIRKLLEDYEEDLYFYLIIDEYDKYTPNDLAYISILETNLEELKLTPGGIINSILEPKIKSIYCGNNSNSSVIISQITKFKLAGSSIDSIIQDRIIFLQPQKIYNDEELYEYAQSIASIDHIDKSQVVQLIQSANYNYVLIDKLFHNNKISLRNINEGEAKKVICEMHEEVFEKKFRSLTNKERLMTVYNIFSYEKIEQIIEKSCYSFQKANYLNYDYSMVIPYVYPDKESIHFFRVNPIWKDFIQSFDFDHYYNLIDFSGFTLGFFKEIYDQTKSQILKGILLEEITFMYYYNKNQATKTFTHTIKVSIYAKMTEMPDTHDSTKFMNPLSIVNNNESIEIKIDTVHKSECKFTDKFTTKAIPTLTNGIYFLSHQFPLIDAFIIDNEKKQIILVQIKKNLKQEDVLKTIKDFNLLYHLIDHDSLYNTLQTYNDEYYNKDNPIKHKTKVFVINIIAKLVREKEYTINFMFTYKEMEDKLNNNTYKNAEIILNADSPTIDIYLADFIWKNTVTLLGVYEYNKNSKKLIIYKKKVMANILMCSLIDFVNGLDKNNKYMIDTLI